MALAGLDPHHCEAHFDEIIDISVRPIALARKVSRRQQRRSCSEAAPAVILETRPPAGQLPCVGHRASGEVELDAPIDWLLEGDAFIEYRTRVDLLQQSAGDAGVRSARTAMLADPRVMGLLQDLLAWPGGALASHKSAGLPMHKLTFLADLGLSAGDERVDEIVGMILRHQAQEGPFQVLMNVATHYGGSGQDTWAWALCDAPLIVYALAKMGLPEHPAVRSAIGHLNELARDNGWPCAVSGELGSFRGPGRKDDPCPYATLAMLKALAQFDDLRDGPTARHGATALLDLWEQSRSRHPYMFFMGTDFRKLKAPLVWYDLLHVVDVLSRFPWLAHDDRLSEMRDAIMRKADDAGRFTPESVWAPWKGWEFGQKREPSRWITLLVWRSAATAGA